MGDCHVRVEPKGLEFPASLGNPAVEASCSPDSNRECAGQESGSSFTTQVRCIARLSRTYQTGAGHLGFAHTPLFYFNAIRRD